MSRITVEKGCFAFVWKIENFEYSVRKNNVGLLSPMFKTRWGLELIFSTSVENRDFFWLRLRNTDSKLQDGTVDCEVSLLAADDTVVRNHNVFGVVVREWTQMSCADCIPISEIAEGNSRKLPPKHTLKVRCRIWQKGMQSGHGLARTVLSRETFVWNIGRFTNDKQNVTKSFELSSRHFTIGLNKSVMTDGNVDVKIVQTDGGDLKFGRCQLAIDGKEPGLLKDHIFVPGGILNKSWHFPINLEQEHLPDDSLSLKCDFTIATNETWIGPSPKLTDSPKRAAVSSRNPQNTASLVQDLLRMYSDQKFCDVTLKSSTGKEFPAHKSILCARSAMFDRMFQDETLSSVDLPDVDSGTLSRLLMFIYIDHSHNLHWNEACALYVAAHKYDLRRLQQECMSVFGGGMTIRRACEALGMVEIQLDEDLRQCVWEFIWERYEDVIGSDEWKALEENKPKLVIQVLRDMGLKKFKKEK